MCSATRAETYTARSRDLIGWVPTKLHLDAHRYKRNTDRGESDSGSLIPRWSRIESGFKVTYPVVVPNRAPFRQKSPGDCTWPLLNQYISWVM